MKAYFLNLQEIRGIVSVRETANYFDNFYNLFSSERQALFHQDHRRIRFYKVGRWFREMLLIWKWKISISSSWMISETPGAISQMSVDGIRISHVTSKTRELSKYMGQVLDEDWKARIIEIQSVGIASVSYDEESQKLINMRKPGRHDGRSHHPVGALYRAPSQRTGSSRFQCKRSDGRLYEGNVAWACRSWRFHECSQQYQYAADEPAGTVSAADEPATAPV